MKYISIIVLGILLILFTSCKKEYVIKDSNLDMVENQNVPYQESYTGTTHYTQTLVDSSIWHLVMDTTYIDTMVVNYRNDSVFFNLINSPRAFSLPPNYNEGFKVDTTKSYLIDTILFGGRDVINYSYQISETNKFSCSSSLLRRYSIALEEKDIYSFQGIKNLQIQ